MVAVIPGNGTEAARGDERVRGNARPVPIVGPASTPDRCRTPSGPLPGGQTTVGRNSGGLVEAVGLC
eukprot:6906649-Lingulodinium_polyedra.AAC.1